MSAECKYATSSSSTSSRWAGNLDENAQVALAPPVVAPVQQEPPFRIPNLKLSHVIKTVIAVIIFILLICHYQNQSKMIDLINQGFTFCQRESNKGLICDLGKTCLNGDCITICGSPHKKCECPHNGPHECHLCCLADGMCKPFSNNNDQTIGLNQLFTKPVGTSCNLTKGKCDSWGHCTPVELDECHSTADGKKCGSNSDNICIENKCQHVCGTDGLTCDCHPGSSGECQTCCQTKNGCESALVHLRSILKPDATSNQFDFINKPTGVTCNFKNGTCNVNGQCINLPFCQRQGVSDGTKCGPEKHEMCRRGSCEHACGSKSQTCLCQVGTAQECHVCCTDQTTGNCISAKQKYKKSFLLRDAGSTCNSRNGTCSLKGQCINLPFCQRQGVSDGTKCGPEKHEMCRRGSCEHACGSKSQMCLCQVGTAEECHVCCTDKTTGNCVSAKQKYDKSFLLRDAGSTCSDSRGSCNQNGQCVIAPSTTTAKTTSDAPVIKPGASGGSVMYASSALIRSLILLFFLCY